MSLKMIDEVNSLMLQRDNILKLLAEYERNILNLMRTLKRKIILLKLKHVKKHLLIRTIQRNCHKKCWFYRKIYCKNGIDCKYNDRSENCATYLKLSSTAGSHRKPIVGPRYAITMRKHVSNEISATRCLKFGPHAINASPPPVSTPAADGRSSQAR